MVRFIELGRRAHHLCACNYREPPNGLKLAAVNQWRVSRRRLIGRLLFRLFSALRGLCGRRSRLGVAGYELRRAAVPAAAAGSRWSDFNDLRGQYRSCGLCGCASRDRGNSESESSSDHGRVPLRMRVYRTRCGRNSDPAVQLGSYPSLTASGDGTLHRSARGARPEFWTSSARSPARRR